MTLAVVNATQFVAAPEPDVTQAITFFSALFPRAGLLHFRSVAEPKDGRPSQNHHYALDAAFANTLAEWLKWCELDQRAAYVLPGYVSPQGTGKADVLSLPCILVDFDKGDTETNLTAAEAAIGPATIVVESGGKTDAGTSKLHAYWKLDSLARGSDIEASCKVREQLALRFGGDTAFKQAAQVIRVPGSIHRKGTPVQVKLRTVRPEARYSLQAIASTLSNSPGAIAQETQPSRTQGTGKAESGFDFDFNNVIQIDSQVDRVLTAPIRSEGQDDVTRFEGAGIAIGHYLRQVREGRLTVEEAWAAAKGWNLANMRPAWDESRLRTDFDRLVRIDIEAHGPLAAPAPVLSTQAQEGWTLFDWRADTFEGEPPARKWLVQGMVPLGTPGVFAAVGDAGKSMLALRLAIYTSCYPTPVDNDMEGFNDCPRFFGKPVVARGSAVILTAEDDKDEVHRRLNSLDPAGIRRGKPLYVVPMISTGGARAVLQPGYNGPEPTAFWHALRAQLIEMPDLKLVILDPASAFVAMDMNDNLTGAVLMHMLAELSAVTGAAVMLVHHFNKSGKGPSNLSDARDSVRGAGALVDNSRWVVVLWEASEDDAYKTVKMLNPGAAMAKPPAGVVYFGGLTKGNAPGEKVVRTMVRNRSSGVLEDMTDTLQAATPRGPEIDAAVYRALVHEKARDPRWSTPKSQKMVQEYVMPLLRRAKLDIGPKEATAAIERLIDAELLVRTADRAARYEPVGG